MGKMCRTQINHRVKFSYTTLDLPATIEEESVCDFGTHVELLDGPKFESKTIEVSSECDGFDFGFLDQAVQQISDKTRRAESRMARHLTGIEELHLSHKMKYPKTPLFADLPALVSDDESEVSEDETLDLSFVVAQVEVTSVKHVDVASPRCSPVTDMLTKLEPYDFRPLCHPEREEAIAAQDYHIEFLHHVRTIVKRESSFTGVA